MTFDEARRRIGLAGHELGGGPSEAVERIVPGLWERLLQEARYNDSRLPEDLRTQYPFDEDKARDRAKSIAYGVAVGLVMGETSEAMAELDKITEE